MYHYDIVIYLLSIVLNSVINNMLFTSIYLASVSEALLYLLVHFVETALHLD